MAENLNNGQLHNDDEQSMISLRDIWNMIWGYKWWYVVCTMVALCAVALYIYRTPNTYVVNAKVIIDESEQYAAVRSVAGISSYMPGGLRVSNTIANEMEAIVSPDLMQIVVERLNLETKYVELQPLRTVELYKETPVELRLAGGNPKNSFSFIISKKGENEVLISEFKIGGQEVQEVMEGTLGDTLVTPVGSIVLVPTMKIDNFKDDILISWANSMAVAKGCCGRLSVALSGKESTVVVLSMNDNWPSRATDVLSSLIDVYNEEWIRNKNRSSKNTSEFINERLLVIEHELGGIENELKDYKASNNLTDMEATAQTYLQESSTYSAKSFEVNNQLSVAEFIKDYLNDPANEAALIPANLGLSSANVEGQISEYNDIVLQRDRLMTGSGSNNPLIADLNASLQMLRSAILRSIDNLIATLELQAQKIRSQENQILARIASSSGQELQLLSIQRQQKVKESLYIFLLEKREENELASLVNVGNTRVIMRPGGSAGLVSPDRMMLLLIALLVGCGVPFAVIFAMRVLDTTVKSKRDFEDLAVPFLAEIPLAVKRNRIGYLSKSAKFDNANCRILVEQGKRDMMNEAFRVFRTNLDMVIEKKPGEAFVTMFTSFEPNAGKTFVIQNIAASMSLKPSKVLILDLDLRKASLSKSLGKEHRGVAAYLNGKVNDYHDHIDKISDGLDLLPVGKLPPNPAELLISDRFNDMIASLRSEYDYIFIDCPPIDIVADAAIVTKVVDMTLFIIRAGVFDKRSISMMDHLYNSGKYRRMSVVLNGVDLESRRYGYSYGYGYAYGYGYKYGYGNSDDK